MKQHLNNYHVKKFKDFLLTRLFAQFCQVNRFIWNSSLEQLKGVNFVFLSLGGKKQTTVHRQSKYR